MTADTRPAMYPLTLDAGQRVEGVAIDRCPYNGLDVAILTSQPADFDVSVIAADEPTFAVSSAVKVVARQLDPCCRVLAVGGNRRWAKLVVVSRTPGVTFAAVANLHQGRLSAY